ncbi:MAG: NAD-dependent epimerase/dehydratase family protein [Bryobacteraceae bacterium]
MESVFVTGATGYIGSAACACLRERGYAVAGLARSEESARKLADGGIGAVRGSLTDTDGLAGAARASDGVIHAAMESGAEAGERDRKAVEAILDALAGSGTPFVYTSGSWVMGSTGGRVAGEMFPLNPAPGVAWRPAVERMVLDATERGVRGIVIRPALVYGRGGGLLTALASGALPWVGDGTNHWSFVHVDDLAGLYTLALEQAPPGSIYVAARGPAIAVAEIAREFGSPAFVPVEDAREELGPIADALVLDQKIGSTRAARELGWRPSGAAVIEEIRRGYRP